MEERPPTHSLEVRFRSRSVVNGERKLSDLDGGVKLLNANFVVLDGA